MSNIFWISDIGEGGDEARPGACPTYFGYRISVGTRMKAGRVHVQHILDRRNVDISAMTKWAKTLQLPYLEEMDLFSGVLFRYREILRQFSG